ncbi:uncharacterized protein LOC128551109 [Mercenaria mercenaria]|uniref:uncharacterized protein LOC128551109 n=1 Tax=Mercenaria mercenaria TaxID=6596 RepID=UPI00234E59E7|nr:uncharacterized protein LOC128551109 [Mercenaria mercenaria]
MINLNAFLDSLKLTWLRRLLKENSKWKLLVDNMFNFNKLLIFGQSYCEATIDTLSNNFWRDVLRSYSKLLQAYVPQGDFDFLSSPLLYNKNIKIGGIPINSQSWYKNGLFYVNDIINQNGVIYTLKELEEKLNIKLNFLQYIGFKASLTSYKSKIPKITGVTKLTYPIRPPIINLFFKSTKGCSDFYNILNKNNDVPTSKGKWDNTYNIENETWKEIYQSPFNLPVSSLLQWFQYRINHRILSTKSYLYKIKIIDSPLCTSCNLTVDETITHMLWSCPETKKSMLHSKNIQFNLSEELYIFNIGKRYNIGTLILILETKYYIFSSKRLGIPLSIKAFKNRIRWSFTAYEHIAKKTNRLDTFEKYLKPILQACGYMQDNLPQT